MKRFFRKINRGLILSLVVILGICGYYAVQSIRSVEIKEEANALLKNFYVTYGECMVFPDEQFKDGQTREDVKPLVAGVAEKFKPYFADEESLKSFMSEFAETNIYRQLVDVNGKQKSATYEYIKLSQLKVDFKKETAVMGAMTSFNSTYIYMENVVDQNGEIVSKREHEQSSKYNQRFSVSMKKVNGKWLLTANTKSYGMF